MRRFENLQGFAPLRQMLARRMGVDRKRLWYVLNGQHSMHVDEFVHLCAVIDV